MGFYIRKSLKAGPLRFNLSKSGVGVSVGVPGFRVGTGPRGNYVHAGRNGLYYRATLGGGKNQRPEPSQQGIQPQAANFNPSQLVMDDVAGATAMNLVPTAGGDIVEQLNAASNRFKWGWIAAAVVAIVGLFSLPRGLFIWAVLGPLCAWLVMQDQARSKVVVFYDIHDAHYAWFEGLFNYWGWLTKSDRIWRVIESGATNLYQAKANGGVSHLVNRVVANANLIGPTHLETNVAIPSITAGQAALYFLPDRLLVREGKSYSDVAYSQLSVLCDKTQFVESSGAPSDAPQLGQTWLRVNKDGTPDRRYNGNKIVPIMEYGELTIASTSGLRWHLQVSRKDGARAIAQALSSVPP